jgi:hypothetical protein
MRPLAAEEILDLERYEAVRERYRERVIQYKRRRRLAVGEKVTLLFEDRETLRFQVQEMLRVERIADPAKVQQELDVYNELMPRENELSATLFVEITDPTRIRAELDRLVGIDEHVSLRIGEDDDEEVVRADFDSKQMEADRIAAVQYVRFRLDPAQALRLTDAAVCARLRIDHPAYEREVEIAPRVRASLVATLGGEIASLLPAEASAEPGAGADTVLLETPRVRALRAGGNVGRVVVEAVEPCSFEEADPELLLELFEALRRASAELTARHGRCRIHADVVRGARRLRWHVDAPGA